MRVYSLDDIREAATPLGTIFDRPVTPAAYVQLRRTASGLTIEDVAARLAPRSADRPTAADLVRTLETPGTHARRRDTIERLAAIFPIDPDVYFQLVAEPADRHPTICRACGCSPNDPCGGDLGVCTAALPGMCSRCIERTTTWAGDDRSDDRNDSGAYGWAA